MNAGLNGPDGMATLMPADPMQHMQHMEHMEHMADPFGNFFAQGNPPTHAPAEMMAGYPVSHSTPGDFTLTLPSAVLGDMGGSNQGSLSDYFLDEWNNPQHPLAAAMGATPGPGYSSCPDPQVSWYLAPKVAGIAALCLEPKAVRDEWGTTQLTNV